MFAFVLSTIGAALACIATIPQIMRILQLKSAHSFSYCYLTLRLISAVFLFLAVAYTGHYFVAFPFIFIMACNGYIIYLKQKFSKEEITQV